MPQWPAAVRYGHELEVLVRALRKDTGKPVPFASVTLSNLGHSSNEPHGIDLVNRGMREVAKALPSMYVIDGSTQTRYFQQPSHCVPNDQAQCMGWLWRGKMPGGGQGQPCSIHGGSAYANTGGIFKGACPLSVARYRGRNPNKAPKGCFSVNGDLHYTARGQMAVGQAFADALLGRS